MRKIVSPFSEFLCMKIPKESQNSINRKEKKNNQIYLFSYANERKCKDTFAVIKILELKKYISLL